MQLQIPLSGEEQRLVLVCVPLQVAAVELLVAQLGLLCFAEKIQLNHLKRPH